MDAELLSTTFVDLADTLDLSRAEIAGLRVEGAFTIT